MNWELIIQCLDLALGILLIIRLFTIQLHQKYNLFCALLIVDLLGSALWILYKVFALLPNRFYILCWLVERPIAWLLTLWAVYILLQNILVQLPGLLRLSTKVLHTVFIVALATGLVSTWLEYSAPGFKNLSGGPLVKYWITELILDRAIATAALLSLVSILVFLLWFPVAIPRNLIVFSVGFAAFFATQTVSLLAHSFLHQEILRAVSILIEGISAICFAFWSFFLTKVGEFVPSRITIKRPPKEQERLVAQLELINDTLLKASRR